MDRIRVAFIGAGHNGQAHMEAHQRVGKSVIYAVCDRNPKRLEEVRKRFGVERCFTGDEIYADPNVDAVSIHTGDPFHVEPFLRAVGNGKHVLVEKPVANSPEQLVRMVEAFQRARPGLKVQCGFILRFNPLFEAVRALSAAGKLGRIFCMECDYIHNLFQQKQQTDEATGRNWYLEEEQPMIGGGCHQLDLLRWFSGREAVDVSGFSNHVAFPEMKNDDCQVALFRFDDGAIAKVACAYGPRAPRPPFANLRLYGTRGTVEGDTVALASGPDDVHPPYQPIEAARVAGHAYDGEIADWLDAIREDRATRCGLHDGANSTMACLKAVEAMATRRPVKIPLFQQESR